ncbi:MAG: hypothetical protein JZD41_01120, partial [Thermoproteus sp.]|nr:hypothetical protein [Thermoproteus sp.]
MDAVEPFAFYGAYYVSIYTGLRARTLSEMVDALASVDGGAIFHHFFHKVREKHLMPPQYFDDFALWVGESLGRRDLAMAITQISGREPKTVEDVRRELIEIMTPHADAAPAKSPFVFVSMEPVVYKTKYVARDLGQFLDAVAEVPDESIVYHFVTRRVLEGAKRNDFSRWLAEAGL